MTKLRTNQLKIILNIQEKDTILVQLEEEIKNFMILINKNIANILETTMDAKYLLVYQITNLNNMILLGVYLIKIYILILD